MNIKNGLHSQKMKYRKKKFIWNISKKQWIERQFKSFVLQLFFPHTLIKHQGRIMGNTLKNLWSVIPMYIIEYVRLLNKLNFWRDEELWQGKSSLQNCLYMPNYFLYKTWSTYWLYKYLLRTLNDVFQSLPIFNRSYWYLTQPYQY